MLHITPNTNAISNSRYPFRQGDYAIRGVRTGDYVSYKSLGVWPDCSPEEQAWRIESGTAEEIDASIVFQVIAFEDLSDRDYLYRTILPEDTINEYGQLLSMS